MHLSIYYFAQLRQTKQLIPIFKNIDVERVYIFTVLSNSKLFNNINLPY